MENFKDFFNNWIGQKVNYQLESIDKICNKLDINAEEWFKSFLERRMRDYSGSQFLDDLHSDFIYFIQMEFEKVLLKYVPASGKNIYQEPYIALEMTLKYAEVNDIFYIKEKGMENFRQLMLTLTLGQKEDLMENRLFSQIVNQTKLEIFSKKEIRLLKLKKLKL
jgi:hypothetical protein